MKTMLASSPASKSAAAGRPLRIAALDALRGLIILVMALDHANHFIAHGKLEPELWADFFPSYAGQPPLTFLTRFVTHLAAPGFFFLMGVGMVLFARSRRRRGWSKTRINRHFWLRGGLLILLQLTLENLAWTLGRNTGGLVVYFGVLYGLGGAMILGAFLRRLPWQWLVGGSGLLILAVDLLLPAARTGFVSYPTWLRLGLLPGFEARVWVLYPVLPWLGVTGLGLGYGRWLAHNRERALRGAFWLGLAALAAFIPLRWLGGLGNIRPPAGPGWIAFLNLVKYPPSLTFLLLTLGSDLLLLAGLARLPALVTGPLAVFGQAPLFFYLAHLYLFGLAGLVIHTSIPQMYAVWLAGTLLLWPLCRWYGRFKHGRPPESIWRLF